MSLLEAMFLQAFGFFLENTFASFGVMPHRRNVKAIPGLQTILLLRFFSILDVAAETAWNRADRELGDIFDEFY